MLQRRLEEFAGAIDAGEIQRRAQRAQVCAQLFGIGDELDQRKRTRLPCSQQPLILGAPQRQRASLIELARTAADQRCGHGYRMAEDTGELHVRQILLPPVVCEQRARIL